MAYPWYYHTLAWEGKYARLVTEQHCQTKALRFKLLMTDIRYRKTYEVSGNDVSALRKAAEKKLRSLGVTSEMMDCLAGIHERAKADEADGVHVINEAASDLERLGTTWSQGVAWAVLWIDCEAAFERAQEMGDLPQYFDDLIHGKLPPVWG